MMKSGLFVLSVLILNVFNPSNAFSSADRQSFVGAGLGFEVISQSGSGTGFYTQIQGGYHFSPLLGIGLHTGYSNVGTVSISAFDFGAFLELVESQSGVYGRFYLDGVSATTKGSGFMHGVDGSQLGFATGVGAGMIIPSSGDLHFAPEITYKAVFMKETLNVIMGTLNVVKDL